MMKMSNSNIDTLSQTLVFDNDLTDLACLCHAGLANDSPYSEQHYLTAILNLVFGYLSPSQRAEVETYINDKKYFPPVEIILETT